MLQNLFRNITPVVKNLIILNLLFFLATKVMENQGIPLGSMLSLHYFDSNLFEPYQIATHFFMHADFFHLLFNMIALFFFGIMMERVWGAKRFLIFYFATALISVLFHQIILAVQSYYLVGTPFPFSDGFIITEGGMNYGPSSLGQGVFEKLAYTVGGGALGASGAIYGILAAAAMLFPNTKVYLYFAIPVKLKYLALGLAAISLYSSLFPAGMAEGGVMVGHLAHLMGMLAAVIIVKIWQRDNTHFY